MIEKMEQQEGVLPRFILGEEMPGYDLPFRGSAFFTQACASTKVEIRMKNGAYLPKSDSVTQFISAPYLSVFCLQIVSNTSTIKRV